MRRVRATIVAVEKQQVLLLNDKHFTSNTQPDTF